MAGHGEVQARPQKEITHMAAPETTCPVTKIKNFCRLISGYGFINIQISYDGEGDSGDFYLSARREEPPAIGNVDDKSAPQKYYDFEQMSEYLTQQPNSLVTQKIVDQFYDAVYEMLPMGWEINDGSFGEINIDVGTGKIQMTHNERITDVNTEEFTY